MPTSVGPNTFGEENLVFGYDLGDVVNSYKGEPTTNIATLDLSNTSKWFSEGGTKVLQTETLDGYPVYRFRSSGSLIYVSPIAFNQLAATTNDVTMAASFKNTGTSAATVNVYLARDFSTDSNGVSNNRTIPADGRWYRHSWTSYAAANLANQVEFRTFSDTLLISKPQVEYKRYATQPVEGTRSATQGLIDLTGNSTINLSTVSFDSNAQVIFDGTDDSITCGTPAYSNRRDFTFVAWVKSDGVLSAARRGLFNASNMSTGYISFFGYTGGAGTLLFETRDSTNSTYLGIGSQAFNIYSGEWVMVGFQIKQGALALFYHNSTTFYYNETADSRTGNFSFQNFGAGSDSSAFRWDGYIDGVRFYDRVLTQDELKANFKALKTRFI